MYRRSRTYGPSAYKKRALASFGSRLARRPRRRFAASLPKSPSRQVADYQDAASSTFLLNRTPKQNSVRVVRTTFNVNQIAGPITDYTAGARFDPSGTNTAAIAFGGTVAGQAMVDWAEFAPMFDEYKVNSITLTFRYTSPGVTPFLPGSLVRCVKNHDTAVPITGSIPLSRFSVVADVLEHSFTSDHPMVKYTFVPSMIESQSGNAAGATTSGPTTLTGGTRPLATTWVDVDSPTVYMGAMAWFNYINTGIQIVVDITYDVSFRNYQ